MTRKRSLPSWKKARNLAYLVGIACLADLAIASGFKPLWAVSVATAVYFWPQGHYGKRGVK